MTKTDYKKIISNLNKKLMEKLELIKKKKEEQELAKDTVKNIMTVDPRQRLINDIAKQYREEIKEKDIREN